MRLLTRHPIIHLIAAVFILCASAKGYSASGSFTTNSPCALAANQTRCTVSLSVSKQNTPVTCLWAINPTQLFACQGHATWSTDWQWTNLTPRIMELRAHNSFPSNTDANRVAGRLLDQKTLVAQRPSGTLTGNNTCVLGSTSASCSIRLNVTKQSVPVACLWANSSADGAPAQLFSCQGHNSWSVDWPYTTTTARTLELRGHQSFPPNTQAAQNAGLLLATKQLEALIDYSMPHNILPYQWGLQAMNFSAAWSITQGNAYIGIHDAMGGPEAAALPGISGVRLQFSSGNWNNSVNAQPHGAHVLGIVAADGSNRLRGGCPGCSLFVSARSRAQHRDSLITNGAQVINFSYGSIGQPGLSHYADNSNFLAFLDRALERDVLIVAASGNFGSARASINQVFDANNAQYPARLAYEGYNNIIPVGGMQPANLRQALINITENRPNNFQVRWTPGQTWNAFFEHDYADCGQVLTSQPAGIDGVMAPGAHILSTYAEGTTYIGGSCIWTDGTETNTLRGDPIKAGDGVGLMTGTSMAAPHITALAGLIRSINPLLSAQEVKRIIQQSSDRTQSPNNAFGHGLPDARRAVDAAVRTNSNGLTPLFAFYSEVRADHFYTTVPQMALSALNGELQIDGTPLGSYASRGSYVANYPHFPGLQNNQDDAQTPKAYVLVYSRPRAPSGQNLAPLYRLSRNCGTTCRNSPRQMDVTYATSTGDRDRFINQGYQLDGIEGYVFSPSTRRPAPGLVRLFRAHNPSNHDHAIFPETEQQHMQSLGYTASTAVLGYVHPNQH